MLITDKKELSRFGEKYRIWQGIPGIEVTKGGRIFSAFYSGGTKEEIGNFALVVASDDGGKSFSEPIAVAYKKEGRCFDEVLWIDPLGRLWFTWGYASCVEPETTGVYGAICDDPDAQELVFSKPFFIGKNVMMNKPTVLSSGEWLFPIAIWMDTVKWGAEEKKTEADIPASYAYRTVDGGKNFERLGGADVPDRKFDEHMILELTDGRLMMLVRTNYGIGVSYSEDKGVTWSEGIDSGIGGPCSRFFIRRLKSGRVLLVNHVEFTGRNNLTALLSEDDGMTWKYKLLLDERSGVSYPDGVEAEDGYIYITYDRGRGGFKKTMEQALSSAREVLFARFTEEDVIAGEIVSEKGALKQIISKLGKYEGGDDPFVSLS